MFGELNQIAFYILYRCGHLLFLILMTRKFDCGIYKVLINKRMPVATSTTAQKGVLLLMLTSYVYDQVILKDFSIFLSFFFFSMEMSSRYLIYMECFAKI